MIGVLLQMQKNDIALYKGEEVRVLSIDADNAYVISLSGKSAPRLAKIDEIDEVEVKEVKQPLTMQTLTANQESIMWKRYRIITPLLIQACILFIVSFQTTSFRDCIYMVNIATVFNKCLFLIESFFILSMCNILINFNSCLD